MVRMSSPCTEDRQITQRRFLDKTLESLHTHSMGNGGFTGEEPIITSLIMRTTSRDKRVLAYQTTSVRVVQTTLTTIRVQVFS